MPMPEPIIRGRPVQSSLRMAILQHADFRKEGGAHADTRHVMGFRLPAFQRGFVWTETQQIRFIESLWLGFDPGSFVLNEERRDERGEHTACSNLLLDGQQRMRALERYINDELAVFGSRWSEIEETERRRFKMIEFPHFLVSTDDEQQLRMLYNRLNFGGTPHRDHERAPELG